MQVEWGLGMSQILRTVQLLRPWLPWWIFNVGSVGSPSGGLAMLGHNMIQKSTICTVTSDCTTVPQLVETQLYLLWAYVEFKFSLKYMLCLYKNDARGRPK